MYSVEDLSAFVCVIEEGSVTGAAKAMNLDPATVSRRLSKLEAKLGVSLIKRSTRRMAITAEGQLFCAHAVAAMRLLRQAEKAVANTEQTTGVAIAAPSWLLQQFVVPALQHISAMTDRTVELIATGGIGSLVNQSAICLSVGQYLVASEHQVCLMKNHKVLCASPAYLHRTGAVSTLQDLRARTCILPSGTSSLKFHDQEKQGEVVVTSEELLCDDEETLLALAIAGQGVVALNSLHAQDALASGELLEVLPGQLRETDCNIYLHCDAESYAMDGVESCFKAVSHAARRSKSVSEQQQVPV